MVKRAEPVVDRTPGGRRRVPLGIREGGAAWAQVHAQLARCALGLLAERGYADMTMDDVAVSADASKRTVYRHYATKVDLAVAAIRILPTFEGWADGDDDLSDRIRRALAIGAAHHHYFAPVLATAIVHRSTVPELLAAMREHVLAPREAVIRNLIEHGQHVGEVREGVDPALVSAMLIGQLMDDLSGMHPLDGGLEQGMQALEQARPMLSP